MAISSKFKCAELCRVVPEMDHVWSWAKARPTRLQAGCGVYPSPITLLGFPLFCCLATKHQEEHHLEMSNPQQELPGSLGFREEEGVVTECSTACLNALPVRRTVSAHWLEKRPEDRTSSQAQKKLKHRRSKTVGLTLGTVKTITPGLLVQQLPTEEHDRFQLPFNFLEQHSPKAHSRGICMKGHLPGEDIVMEPLLNAATNPTCSTQHCTDFEVMGGTLELPVCCQEGRHHLSLCLPLDSHRDPPENTATPAALSAAYSFSHTQRPSGEEGGTGLFISPMWSYQVYSLHHFLTISSFEFHGVSVTIPINLTLQAGDQLVLTRSCDFSSTVSEAKSAYLTKINSSASNPRKLFSTFTSLLIPPSPLPPSSLSADDFATYFTKNLPLPDPLLQTISSDILAFLTILINSSLNSGLIPASFKTARDKPLHKTTF
ncbi:hypothetical protein N1851_003797 [Merluccius polli]|uniref:Uncharacterized protein n=1 Tax=Merluccius polli TaxID=89951 RepID=A0AA47N812_MERPO|nr:hypothetical protein N1851_003797 [Merluccius polli]